MKEAREEFIKKMKGSIGKHTSQRKGTDYDPEDFEITDVTDLKKELEKRIREILGEE